MKEANYGKHQVTQVVVIKILLSSHGYKKEA